jgi:hypothetical protein
VIQQTCAAVLSCFKLPEKSSGVKPSGDYENVFTFSALLKKIDFLKRDVGGRKDIA